MPGKTQMSLKTKKILTGVGIGFGTVMVFIVSFILAFSLIVNPINFFTVSDAGTVEENEKLKEEVQTLNDEIEHLNTTVDKYKAAATAPSPSVPAVVTTPSESSGSASQGSGSQTSGSQASTGDSTQKPSSSGTAPQPQEGTSSAENGSLGSETNSGFSPDVVDSSAEQTPEDVEVEIPVIDISE